MDILLNFVVGMVLGFFLGQCILSPIVYGKDVISPVLGSKARDWAALILLFVVFVVINLIW